LQQFLLEGATATELLSPGGALGDFQTRRQLAYTLGLVSKSTSEELEKIQQIRNHFAHSTFGMTFNDERVSQLCQRLELETDLRRPGTSLEIIDQVELKSPRSRYGCAILLMAIYLLNLSRNTAKQESEPDAGLPYQFMSFVEVNQSHGT
jgi:DNA-binding MltR family transcriptional regulator